MLKMTGAPVVLSMLVSATGSFQSGSRFEARLLSSLSVPAGSIDDVAVGKA